MKKIAFSWRKMIFFSLGVVWGLEWMNIFKPSLRSRMMYGLIRLFYKKPVIEDVAVQRGYLGRLQDLVPAPLKVDVNEVMADGIPCEWILPGETISTQVVFYLHGGAYVTKMPVLHRSFLHRLAAASTAQFLMVDYRLAPENPFPAALADALTAYQWFLRQGWRQDQIMIAGDSAGGGLTMALLQVLRDLNLPLPVGAILISPWTDLTGSGESNHTKIEEDVLLDWENLAECARDYAGNQSLEHPWISPLFGDFHGLPDTLILVGDAEILRDDSTRLSDRMSEDGVQIELVVEPYMGHVYPAYAGLPEAQQAIKRIADFIVKC